MTDILGRDREGIAYVRSRRKWSDRYDVWIGLRIYGTVTRIATGSARPRWEAHAYNGARVGETFPTRVAAANALVAHDNGAAR